MLDNMGVYKRNEIVYRRKLRDNDWTRTSYWGVPYKTFEALTKLLISFLGCVFILFGIPMQLRSITHGRHKTSQLFLKICLLMFSFSLLPSSHSSLSCLHARSWTYQRTTQVVLLRSATSQSIGEVFMLKWRPVISVTLVRLVLRLLQVLELVLLVFFFERDVGVLQRTTFLSNFCTTYSTLPARRRFVQTACHSSRPGLYLLRNGKPSKKYRLSFVHIYFFEKKDQTTNITNVVGKLNLPIYSTKMQYIHT